MESPAAEAGIFTINQYNKYARGVNAAPEWLIFGDLIDRLVFAELRRIKSEVDLLLESEISRKRLS
ncbi:hypothetical protein A3765_28345 [Oleiphilus sp. HI0130]|nr:hypothetical protein A3765_28345 [Oleiphilus sp. HI0130]